MKKSRKTSKETARASPTGLQSIGLIEWSLIFLVFFLPLIFNPFGYNMFASFRVALLYLLATITLGSMFLKSLSEGQFRIKKSPLDLMIILFTVALVASTFNSVHLSTSIFGHIWRYEGLLAWLSYFVIYFATIYAITEKKQQVRLLYAMTCSALLISIYGISQHFGFDFIPWSPDQDLTRSISTLGGPTYLGAYLVLLLPLALILAFTRECPPRLRRLSQLAAVLMALALLFTFARGAWLALIVSLLFLFLMNFRAILRSKLVPLLIVGLLLLSYLLFASGQLSPYVKRAKSAFNLTRGSSGGIRLLAWQQTIEMVKDRPLLGWGPETFSLVFPRYIRAEWEQTVRRDFPTDKAHNDLLQVASTMGLVSLVPYILIFIFFFWHSLRSIRRVENLFQKNLLKGLLAGVMAYLAQLQFGFSVVDVTPIFWVFIGMAMSLSSLTLTNQERIFSLPFKIVSPTSLKLAWGVLALIILGISIFAAKPILADIYLRRGIEALQRNEPAAAVAELSTARSLDIKEPYYSQTLGQVYTKLLNATGDKSFFNRAVKVLGEGQRINHLNEYTYLYLGDAYLAGAEVLGKPSLLKLAAANYQKVLANDRNFAQVHLSLGIAYAQMKMTEKAINEWKTVSSLYPAADAAYYNLGVTYEQTGKPAEALDNFKKVLELNPANQLAMEAMSRLQNPKEEER